MRAGDGVRWEAAEILPSSGFKCGGVAGEPLKTAVTDDDTIVMQARFYRQGDGANASFTAKVFVSAVDENPDQPGAQNVWIQGVGCAEGGRMSTSHVGVPTGEDSMRTGSHFASVSLVIAGVALCAFAAPRLASAEWPQFGRA